MRGKIKELVEKACEECMKEAEIAEADMPAEHQISVPKQESHGDFASNLALMLASRVKRSPVEIASLLSKRLSLNPFFEKVEVAGPGFLNLFIARSWWQQSIKDIKKQGQGFYLTGAGAGKRALLEFVSANPTGPLHVGHGRGAAVGDSLARILKAAGFEVETEYYINDAGNQMNTLGLSVFLRYQELLGKKIEFPADCYQGDYIVEIAKKVLGKSGDVYLDSTPEEVIPVFTETAVEKISAWIKDDLKDFGVLFDNWFSEKTLHSSGLVEKSVNRLQENGFIYEKDGALWFKTSDFGDEKDRVVKRANGILTYFAADIAYHREKCERGYNFLVDIWGADHHGYVPRVKAAIEAQGYSPDILNVMLVQLVNLMEKGEKKAMSTRSGEFVPLREVLDEVGRDAARFIFLTRKCDSKLDFDLDLAKSQTQDNPVFYVQYAHARLASVFRNAAEQSIGINSPETVDTSLLDTHDEIKLIKFINGFPGVVSDSALALEPHRISYYLTELAGLLHSYYNKHRFISEERELTQSRLLLADVCKDVLNHGLAMLGVSAPEKM